MNHVEFKEPGIDCEMCHGPSVQHVIEMTTSEPYPKAALDPPVNFHDLGNRDFNRICAQCHMQSAIRASGSSGELNYSSAGEFFPRNLSIPFGEFSRMGFYKDGRFRQTTFIVEALRTVSMFQEGTGELRNLSRSARTRCGFEPDFGKVSRSAGLDVHRTAIPNFRAVPHWPPILIIVSTRKAAAAFPVTCPVSWTLFFFELALTRLMIFRTPT